MRPDLTPHRAAIAELCRRYGVLRLDLFGSAARGTDFDPARSDFDFVVEFEPDRTPAFGDFLDFREALAALLGRPVDLTMATAIRNPYLRAEIERDRVKLHGA